VKHTTTENKGVLVFGEVLEGKLTSITLELLGCGRRLADALSEGLFLVLVGSSIQKLGKEAIAFGADRVYLVDDPLLKEYQSDIYTQVIEKIVRDISPNILLLGQTSIGRDLAPRLAFRLETGLSMDCVELNIDPASKLLLQIRPVYGCKAMAVYVCEKTKPQMATVRAKAFSPLERTSSGKGEVIKVEPRVDPSTIRTKLVKKVKEEVEGVKLEDADVVICGGRGMGSAEAFKELEKLARILEGAVGASRPPRDKGWVPSTWQIGLTGKTVSPTLYIGVALSGSTQHMAGCSKSKNIIAINKDPAANIFKYAHYGVIGDYREVLPAFTRKVEELLRD
jgi:electron transfer flavoprotein alpha subunit